VLGVMAKEEGVEDDDGGVEGRGRMKEGGRFLMPQ
jgi:hypothetical protein